MKSRPADPKATLISASGGVRPLGDSVRYFNAFDDARVAHAIEATGRAKLIFAGISLIATIAAIGPEAGAVYGAVDMPWAKLVGQIAQAYGK